MRTRFCSGLDRPWVPAAVTEVEHSTVVIGHIAPSRATHFYSAFFSKVQFHHPQFLSVSCELVSRPALVIGGFNYFFIGILHPT